VGLRAIMDTEVRGKNPLSVPGIEPRSPGLPVRSQTLYCLNYPTPNDNNATAFTRPSLGPKTCYHD
jgi:hypothetical protein